MEKNLVGWEYLILDIIMRVIYCCLEKEKEKVLKFHINNLSYFETTTVSVN